MKKILLVLFFIYLGISTSLAENPAYDREVSFSRKIFNFHFVEPQIMRGSQPGEDGFRLLKKFCGVKTVLDLRNDKANIEWEKAVVEKLGMDFISIPMNAKEEQGVEKIEKCLNILQDKAKQPVFVHCQAGKDRTGMVFAAYRIKYQNWDLKDALLEMLSYGYDRARCFKLERSLAKWYAWRENNPEVVNKQILDSAPVN